MEENTQEGVESQESAEEQQSPEQEAQEAVAENQPDDGDITPEEQDAGSDATESQQESEDNTEKRINDLMSKWQSEEHQRKTLEEENKELKQKLSKNKGDDNQGRTQNDDSDLPPYYQEGWKPKSYDELAQAIKMAEERGHKKALSKLEERQQVQQQAQEQLDSFISEVKDHDDEFNEDAFYDYANKHNFPVNSVKDLRSVYSAYVSNRQAIKKAEQRAKKNKEKRQGTGVGKPGAGKSSSKGASMKDIRGSSSVLDMVKNRGN